MINIKYLKLLSTALNILVGCYVFMYAFNWLAPDKTAPDDFQPNVWQFSWFLTDSSFILLLSLIFWRCYGEGVMKLAMMWFFIQSLIRFYYEFPYFYSFNNKSEEIKVFIAAMSAMCCVFYLLTALRIVERLKLIFLFILKSIIILFTWRK